MFPLHLYLARIGLEVGSLSGRPLLAAVMAAHSRAIAFENLDIVCGGKISMEPADVVHKLLGPGSTRGGYCFEQNQLLQLGLTALGFEVAPLLCRVRWGKRSDPFEHTAFTHMALRVRCAAEAASYLADVGFAGTNSIAPLELDAPAQLLPEGSFRALADATVRGYTTLQLESGGGWRDLYMWRSGETAEAPDLAVANWWSCTGPTARFTNSFFVARVVGEARHHILNGRFVSRSLAGGAPMGDVRITSEEHLAELLMEVFGLSVSREMTAAWAAKYNVE